MSTGQPGAGQLSPGQTEATVGLRLLVVDDEEQILELLDLTLSLKGYTVHTARGGPEALLMAQSHPIDVIVLDILMTPWDGYETVRHLHRQYAASGAVLPPVVFLSGLNRPEQMPPLDGVWQEEYLVKPFRPSQLVEAIERVWRGRLPSEPEH